MRDILPALYEWYAAGSPFGLATVVAVDRSAPRDPGAAMAVGPGDEIVGSVSGGCVEGAVFELAREVIASGEARLETFGYSDEDAFAVGLTCGGEITLLVRRVSAADDPAFAAVAESVAAGRPVTLATVLDGPAPRGRRWPSGPTRPRPGAGPPARRPPPARPARRARTAPPPRQPGRRTRTPGLSGRSGPVGWMPPWPPTRGGTGPGGDGASALRAAR